MIEGKDKPVGYGMAAIAICLVLAITHGWIPL